jgi:hypothetical protein
MNVVEVDAHGSAGENCSRLRPARWQGRRRGSAANEFPSVALVLAACPAWGYIIGRPLSAVMLLCAAQAQQSRWASSALVSIDGIPRRSARSCKPHARHNRNQQAFVKYILSG